jgi:hypothetical protein
MNRLTKKKLTSRREAVSTIEKERDAMVYKSKISKNRVCYPLNIQPQTYDLISEIAESYKPEVTRAAVIREALSIGLKILKERQDDQAKS